MMGLDMKDSHVYRRVNESGGVEKLENLDPAVQPDKAPTTSRVKKIFFIE